MSSLARRDVLVAWYQYAGLWALAIAWPAYQNIASGPEALTDLGARRLELVAVIAAISLLGPTLITVVEVLVRLAFGDRGGRRFRAFALGSLVALFTWQHLAASGAALVLQDSLPFLVWAGVAFLYLGSEFARNFVGILGLATPVVIVAFCLLYPIDYEVLPHDKAEKISPVKSDAPVVMVIFDELPLASLENQRGGIDSTLFPTFGKLAATSTWYPDMTAVADQTTEAVPAILSGRTPEDTPGAKPLPPGLPSYPNNVCSDLKANGYSVFAYEPVTDLCHRTHNFGTRVGTLIQRGVGLGDDMFPTNLEIDAATTFTNTIGDPWDSEFLSGRERAIDEFIQKMPATKRSLSVLHIMLPHVLWQFLPDGKMYPPDDLADIPASELPSNWANTDHFLQQLLLQLGYADTKLGQIIDRLKSEGVWNESMFVVTADHGASSRPGTNRRTLSDDNLGWILPIPLLIKYPGQKNAKVVRGGANSSDITPTILDTLGSGASSKASGISLQGRHTLPEATKLEAQGYGGRMEPAWRDVRKQFLHARRHRNAVFGNGGGYYALGGHPELLGKRPEQVKGLTPLPAIIPNASAYRDVALAGEKMPSYLRAALQPDDKKNPGDVAIALNDRIVATTRSWASSYLWVTAINLPEQAFQDGNNKIEFYEIGKSAQ